MFDCLNADYQKVLASAKEEKNWIPLSEVKNRKNGHTVLLGIEECDKLAKTDMIRKIEERIQEAKTEM